MAPGIATACSTAGAEVRLAGRDPERVADAARAASALAGVSVTPMPLAPDTFFGGELAVETVVEDVEVKIELLQRIEGWLPQDAVLATNTSSFSIEVLARALARPGRFAGFHFLNPAHLTAVVEVVPGPATDQSTIDVLADLARWMGKTPLVLRRDVPGFIWNRLQFALIRECLHLLDEGVAHIASIDAAVSDGLAPRWLAGGPLATADLGGLDTFRRAAARLFPELAGGGEVSPALARRAAQGGSFYRWSEESRRAIETIRAEALALGRELAERRRASSPQGSES